MDGLRLETQHYEILTTAQDATLRDCVPQFMEACWSEYQRWIPLSGEHGQQLRAYLFDTRQQWAAFTRQFAPAQADLYLHLQAGGYMDHATKTIVVYDVGRDRTLALLAHEGLHQYLAANTTCRIPAWLNEGLATQFEAFDLHGDEPTFKPRENLFRKNSLREALSSEATWIPLRTLLAMDAGHAVMQTGQTARGYYAQIWALVLFLHEEQRYAAGLQRMLRDIAASPAMSARRGEEPFRSYMTDDLDGCEERYHSFARSLVR